MKKLILALTLGVLALSSCQKSATVVSTTSNSDETLATDVHHYYQGHSVTHSSEIASYMTETSATLYTDKLNGEAAYYYFDSEADELNFIQEHPVLQPFAQRILQAQDLRQYITNHQELAYIQQHGTCSEDYQSYASRYNKSRGLYTVYAALGGGAGASLYIPMAGVAAFPAMIDNLSKSFNSPAGQGLVYKNPGFAGASLGIFATAGPVNFVPVWRNVISSAL